MTDRIDGENTESDAAAVPEAQFVNLAPF